MQYAIGCSFAYCAVFGYDDICVRDNSNANRDSCPHIGTRYGDGTYVNDTAFADFFTGARDFTVKEIEVFEIAH
jgi:hypothetical protein